MSPVEHAHAALRWMFLRRCAAGEIHGLTHADAIAHLRHALRATGGATEALQVLTEQGLVIQRLDGLLHPITATEREAIEIFEEAEDLWSQNQAVAS